jgi:tetratricopeptide (TPR) repeat protein
LLAEGEFALVLEELESALMLEGQPVKRGTMAHEHIVYMMLADTAAQLGDTAAIDRYLSKLEPLAEKDNHRPYLAVAHRARGIAHRHEGEHGKSEDQLNQALDIFNDFDAPWQIGRTYCELAELELARSDHKRAHEQYVLALAEFEKVQAIPDLKRTREALEAVESLN